MCRVQKNRAASRRCGASAAVVRAIKERNWSIVKESLLSNHSEEIAAEKGCRLPRGRSIAVVTKWPRPFFTDFPISDIPLKLSHCIPLSDLGTTCVALTDLIRSIRTENFYQQQQLHHLGLNILQGHFGCAYIIHLTCGMS